MFSLHLIMNENWLHMKRENTAIYQTLLNFMSPTLDVLVKGGAKAQYSV